ncbi:MAG: GNAT family N-acetyltransferase [Filifactor alocis]|nr:GNAT family N-acetyltransferase [Filifactor alocis]
METLELRAATASDEKEIMDLLKETATWLKEKGSKQWNGILEGRDNHHTDVAIAKGNVFVLEEEHKIVAVMILYPSKTAWDTVLWKEEEEMDAFYLHRLTLSLDRRGERLAHRCLQWAIDHARKEGKAAVRLDCLKKIPYLNQLYAEAGFRHLRTVEDFNANEQIADFSLYEYKV